MRKSEQFTPTWDQVDLERGYNYLSMTKNGSDRFVTLNSVAVQVLRSLQERHKRLGLPPDSTLFHSKREGLIKNPRKWFATALEQAEIKDVTWHTLRHTFASRLVMGGVDLKTVQELMGHKDDRYDRPVRPPRADSQVAGTGDLGTPGVSFGTKRLQIGYQRQKVAHGQGD